MSQLLGATTLTAPGIVDFYAQILYCPVHDCAAALMLNV